MDGRLNDSFRAMNLLLDKSGVVRRVDKPAAGLRAGDFVVTAGSEAAGKLIDKYSSLFEQPGV